MTDYCPGCKCDASTARKIVSVGDKLSSDQYHYDIEWLVQCDKCKTVFTVVV